MNKNFMKVVIFYVLVGGIFITLGATKIISKAVGLGIIGIATVGFIGYVAWWYVGRNRLVKEALYGHKEANTHQVKPITLEECLGKLEKIGFSWGEFGGVYCCIDDWGNQIAIARSEESV